MNAVVANFRGLADFNGRAGRGRFWPYAACVIALTFLGMLAVMIPVMNDFFAKAAKLAAENPEAVTVQAGPGGYSVQVEPGRPDVLPDFGLLLGGMGVVIAATVVLLAAAVSRRLHDSGLSAWLGLLPLPFLGFGLVGMAKVFASVARPEGPDMTLFLAVFLNNMAYLAALGTLVLLLCRPSTPGPNRFGRPSGA